MNALNLTHEGFAVFFLVLARCSGIFGFSPVLSGMQIPMQVKIGLSFFIAVTTFQVVIATSSYTVPDNVFEYALAVAAELFVGLCIGFVTALVMTCVQVAGTVIDFEMGFGMVNVVDPLSNVQTTVMGQLYIILATLLFIVMRGDHVVIRAVVGSYAVVPLSGTAIGASTMYSFWDLLARAFITSFKIGGPIIASLFLATIGLGIVARTVPQMNVLMVGFPLKIGIGLLAATAAVPFVVAVLRRLYGELPGEIMVIVRTLGG
ncbi:MAG: flagellar biosynthetic protein FliR [Bacillota bacterium]|jgi:flagellar biosynthetic protein FliR|nr:flagellar type III secretion system protein FliR [Bacillota bacterium]HOB92063.1 flagellar biosynthetic protein FliR [Bacillota bacterium]HPZ54372.1 flagellar biosynthetic protein FliR [Bacillota bacterium]HQD18555.1 flagellar biosynthetic protein FliR [Bacillota bacterium]